MRIDWAWQKAVLMFLGFIAKGMAMGDPLPFEWGAKAKAVCGVIWFAFDAAFMWLLRPPAEMETVGTPKLLAYREVGGNESGAGL